MAWQYPITIAEFRDYFASDFDLSTVSDATIELYFEEARAMISNCLVRSRYYKSSFRDLVAFLYCQKNGDLKGQGTLSLSGTIASWSNGSFSKSYNVPKAFIDNPTFAMFASNRFGLSYLQKLYPCTRASLFFAIGRTNKY